MSPSVVCLSVCLSARITRKLLFYACCPSPHGSFLLRWRCDTLSTSGFADDITLSYHGASGPELNTTVYFDEARQVAAPVGRQTTSVWSSLSKCWRAGAKSTVYDCLVIASKKIERRPRVTVSPINYFRSRGSDAIRLGRYPSFYVAVIMHHSLQWFDVPSRITQCYLPSDRGDIPSFIPANHTAGTRFSDPRGMQGWVDLVGLVAYRGGVVPCNQPGST